MRHSNKMEHTLIFDISSLYHSIRHKKVSFNPNSIRSYKIVQKLSPKHAARGIAQSPYPTYRHGKACLSKQPPWRAAGDPRLARGRSRVRGPAGALRALFFSTFPSFLLREIVFFRTFPTKPVKPVVRLGLKWHQNQACVPLYCVFQYRSAKIKIN